MRVIPIIGPDPGRLCCTAKPLPGLAPDGNYRFVGDVRHRGVELSLAGPLAANLHAVVGATWFAAELSGELVDLGLIGPRPVGRAEQALLLDLSWRVPGRPGLTVDGGASWRGRRPADDRNRLELPAVATVDLGLRQSFRLDGRDFTLRWRAVNLFSRFAWNVSSSGLYLHNAPREFTLTLTAAM